MKNYKNVTKKIFFFEIKGVSHSIKPGAVSSLDPENDYVAGLISKGHLVEVNEKGNTEAEQKALDEKGKETGKGEAGKDKSSKKK